MTRLVTKRSANRRSPPAVFVYSESDLRTHIAHALRNEAVIAWLEIQK